MNEAEVKIEQEPGIVKQWGREWLFQRSGFKTTFRKKVLVAIGGCTFVVTAITLTMTSDPPKETTQSSGFVGQPTMTSGSEVTEVPEVGVTASTSGRSQSGQRGLRRQVGPQIIVRTQKLQVPPGTLTQAVLISGASNGPTRAKINSPLDLNGETLIPSGSIFVGQGSSTEERLFIRFQNIVFPDGHFESVQAQACDSSDKIVGLKGSRVGRYALKMVGSIGLGFLGGLSDGLQETEVQGGVPVKSANLRNALLRGTSQAALDQSKELMSGIKEKAPIIEVKEGTEICIMFEGN